MKQIKKLIAILIIINLQSTINNLNAQTAIPAGDVSGTWAASGSPYQIMGDITVQAGETLEIQAGVKVEFQGHYYMLVYGKLQARGEAESMIHFTVNDTTGFHNNETDDGAWSGIWFVNNSIDLSIIDYCKMQYVKGPGISVGNYQMGIIKKSIFKNIKKDNYSSIRMNNTNDFFIISNKICNCSTGLNINSQNIILSNNLICNNKLGIIITSNSTGYFTNNTTSNNEISGLRISRDNVIDISNCIVSGNIIDIYDPIPPPKGNNNTFESEINFNNCLIDGGESNITNDGGGTYYLNNCQTSNPQFINPTVGIGTDYNAFEANWKLDNGSPCIDAGTPDTAGMHIPETDLAGDPRIYNSRIDIGAYEYQGYVSTKNVNRKPQVNIYPIPSTETVKILFQRINAPQIFVNVYNIQGKQVYKNIISNTSRYSTETLHFAKYPKGTYLINIKYGNESFTRKIIIN